MLKVELVPPPAHQAESLENMLASTPFQVLRAVLSAHASFNAVKAGDTLSAREPASSAVASLSPDESKHVIRAARFRSALAVLDELDADRDLLRVLHAQVE